MHHDYPEPRLVTVGVVAVVFRDGRFLMIRRGQTVVAPGAWCFVGGAAEPGEPLDRAVRREFREEVGGEIVPQRVIWEYVSPDGRLHLHWWLAELGAGELHPHPREVAEIRWCTPEEIDALDDVLDSNRAFLRWWREQPDDASTPR